MGYSKNIYQRPGRKLYENMRNFYKGILAGSLAVPLLINVGKASSCDLECNVKKDGKVMVKAEKNLLGIPVPKEEDFRYRHTAVEQTPIGSGIFVYDGYSINDPKKEKIDFMVKSQLVVPKPQHTRSKESKTSLIPFQYMWIDKHGKGNVVIDYDGKINGNEVDISEEYKEMINQLTQQQEERDFSKKNREVDV